jgi:secernin
MCDTLVALGNATEDGSVIFAKNSDREANEAHMVTLVPAAEHEVGSTVQCTYVAIPQVQHTHAVLLAKPFWIWGAEMGANEHGVVIGNEAVFTRVPYEKGPSLTGMDLLRLALERARTALDALQVMTHLLEEFGQGGNCGFTHAFYYHNSFLIADREQAWVLETAGKQWAAEQVADIRTISNAITIGNHWDRASADLVNYAVEKGWCKGRDDFHFARCYSDPLYTRLSDAGKRQCSTADRLQAEKGKINIQTAMSVLRSHAVSGESFSPDRGITGADVCMHASWGPVRKSQSTGSMVSHLTGNVLTHWVTGTSAPCTSIFKPVWIDAGLPDLGPVPEGFYQGETLWWRHELFHREVLRDYRDRLPNFQTDQRKKENTLIERASLCRLASANERLEFSRACFSEAEEAEREWTRRIRDLKIVHHLQIPYAIAWKGFNRQAKLG